MKLQEHKPVHFAKEQAGHNLIGIPLSPVMLEAKGETVRVLGADDFPVGDRRLRGLCDECSVENGE